jgi:hypothetical protein
LEFSAASVFRAGCDYFPFIIPSLEAPVNWRSSQCPKRSSHDTNRSRYNLSPRAIFAMKISAMTILAMRSSRAFEPESRFSIWTLIASVLFLSACTMYPDHAASKLSDATGGEGLERIFWKNIQAANWLEVDRALASNYVGVMPAGPMDRDSTLEKYRSWHLKDFSIGDLKTEMNGDTIVVYYSITLNGVMSQASGATQSLPSTPLHMMTVWQQQKSGWIVIAHSMSES